MEHTLVIIKPNGVQNSLTGEILSRYEKSRLSISAIKILRPKREKFENFYIEHQGKEFYKPLVDFMCSGPIVVITLYGEDAVSSVRQINGATCPEDAAPGTIRHNYAPNTRQNIVHASDSPQSAKKEILFWFDSDELIDYNPKSWITAII